MLADTRTRTHTLSPSLSSHTSPLSLTIYVQTMEGKVLEAMEILRATRASAASAVSAAQLRTD